MESRNQSRRSEHVVHRAGVQDDAEPSSEAAGHRVGYRPVRSGRDPDTEFGRLVFDRPPFLSLREADVEQQVRVAVGVVGLGENLFPNA